MVVSPRPQAFALVWGGKVPAGETRISVIMPPYCVPPPLLR